jgi:hypothetical protein
MNAADFVDTPLSTPPADAPVAETTTPEPTANELFAQAWGGGGEPETPPAPDTPETPPADTPESGQEEPSAALTSSDPPSQTAAPELTQDYIDAQVKERLAAAQQQAAEDAQRKQFEDAFGQMSDAEYGKFMRQYQQQVAQFKSAQEAAMVNFYRESTTDVLTKIPELKSLTPDESARIDPRKASSYSELVSRMADVVAEKRATKLAEPKAKELFEAWKTNEQAKLAKQARTVSEMSGMLPGHEPDFDNSTGKAILEYAFSNQR